MIHPGNLFVHGVDFRVAGGGVGHLIRVVEKVIGHRRRTGRMGPHEGHEAEIGPLVPEGIQLFHHPVRHKALHRQPGREGTQLGEIIHIGAFPVELLNVVIFRMLPHHESRVSVPGPLLGITPHFLGVHLLVIAHVLQGALGGMELADAEGAVAPAGHFPGQIIAAALVQILAHAGHGPGCAVVVAQGGVRLPTRAQGQPRRGAHRAGGIGVVKADSPAHQPIQIRRGHIGVSLRRDAVKPELIAHQVQNVWELGHVLCLLA